MAAHFPNGERDARRGIASQLSPETCNAVRGSSYCDTEQAAVTKRRAIKTGERIPAPQCSKASDTLSAGTTSQLAEARLLETCTSDQSQCAFDTSVMSALSHTDTCAVQVANAPGGRIRSKRHWMRDSACLRSPNNIQGKINPAPPLASNQSAWQILQV